MARKIRRTQKQKELMTHIIRAAGEGSYLTQKTLHELVSYDCTYGAVRVSVNFLAKWEMIEKRPAGREVQLVPTTKGYDWFRLRT